jgi:hypothetical protein
VTGGQFLIACLGYALSGMGGFIAATGAMNRNGWIVAAGIGLIVMGVAVATSVPDLAP